MTFSTSRSFSSAMRGFVVPHGYGCGDKGLADRVGTEFLQRRIGIHGLVVGVGIEQRRGLVGHHLLQDRRDRFALGEPLPPDFGQQPRGIGLVEHDRAGRPAIGKGQPIEFVQNPGRGGGRETRRPSAPADAACQASARARRSAAGRPAPRRDTSVSRARERAGAWSRRSRMQIGQRFPVIEPSAFRHKPFDQPKHAVGPVDKSAQRLRARRHPAVRSRPS